MIQEEDTVYEVNGSLRSRKLRRGRGGERDRGSDGSGAPRVSLDPPKETGQGRTLRQEIKRIDTALRTHDRAVLAEYGEFNAAMKKGSETR